MKVLEKNSIVNIKANNVNFNELIKEHSFVTETVETSVLMDMVTNTEYSKVVVAIKNNGTTKALNFCSKVYKLLNPFEYWTKISDLLIKNNIEFEFQAEIKNDVFFNAKFLLKKMNGESLGLTVGNKKDALYYSIFLGSSLNGLQMYSICGGFFRLICSNGMKIWFNKDQAFEYKGKHTGSMENALNSLEANLNEFIKVKGFKTLTKKFNLLYNTKVVNYGQRVEEVMKAVGIKKGLDDITATIKTEMSELGEMVCNDWLIYNGINNAIYDNAKNVKSSDVRDELDRKVFAEIIR